MSDSNSSTGTKLGIIHEYESEIGARYPIGGYKYPGARGWNNVLRGLYGNVQNRLTSQNGVQLFDPSVSDLREMLVLGSFIFKMLRAPAFWHPDIVEVGRFMFEDNVKAVSGIPENSIEALSLTYGPNGATSNTPGRYKQSFSSFTITTTEYAGSICRKLVSYWMNGISDKETGIGHFYGKNLPFVKSSYTATFIYIILGRTGRPDDIEFSCMFHNAWTGKEITSHLSSNTLSDPGSVGDIEIEFYADYQESPSVDVLAQLITASVGLWSESYLDQQIPAGILKLLGPLAVETGDKLEAYRQKYSLNTRDRLKSANESDPYTTYDDTAIDYMHRVNAIAFPDYDQNNPAAIVDGENDVLDYESMMESIRNNYDI